MTRFLRSIQFAFLSIAAIATGCGGEESGGLPDVTQTPADVVEAVIEAYHTNDLVGFQEVLAPDFALIDAGPETFADDPDGFIFAGHAMAVESGGKWQLAGTMQEGERTATAVIGVDAINPRILQLNMQRNESGWWLVSMEQAQRQPLPGEVAISVVDHGDRVELSWEQITDSDPLFLTISNGTGEPRQCDTLHIEDLSDAEIDGMLSQPIEYDRRVVSGFPPIDPNAEFEGAIGSGFYQPGNYIMVCHEAGALTQFAGSRFVVVGQVDGHGY